MALFLAFNVNGATIHGTIYDSDIEILEGGVITINTIPEQTAVALDGSYSFEVNIGSYLVKFEYFENNDLIYFFEEEISIIEDGDYLMDVILLPDLNDDLTEDNLDILNPYEENNHILVRIGVLIILLGLIYIFYIFWKKLNGNFWKKISKQKKTSLEEDDIEKVLDFITQEGGRTTQKDIRRKLLLSEAKASLILTELEHDKKIRRIKKGRGNIISLIK